MDQGGSIRKPSPTQENSQLWKKTGRVWQVGGLTIMPGAGVKAGHSITETNQVTGNLD